MHISYPNNNARTQLLQTNTTMNLLCCMHAYILYSSRLLPVCKIDVERVISCNSHSHFQFCFNKGVYNSSLLTCWRLCGGVLSDDGEICKNAHCTLFNAYCSNFSKGACITKYYNNQHGHNKQIETDFRLFSRRVLTYVVFIYWQCLFLQKDWVMKEVVLKSLLSLFIWFLVHLCIILLLCKKHNFCTLYAQLHFTILFHVKTQLVLNTMMMKYDVYW